MGEFNIPKIKDKLIWSTNYITEYNIPNIRFSRRFINYITFGIALTVRRK